VHGDLRFEALAALWSDLGNDGVGGHVGAAFLLEFDSSDFSIVLTRVEEAQTVSVLLAWRRNENLTTLIRELLTLR